MQLLHYRETLHTGLLNISKKQEIREMGRGRGACVHTEEVVGVAREAIIRNPNTTALRSAQQLRSQSARHGKSVVMTCRCFRTKRN
jgi:hypothetical protein